MPWRSQTLDQAFSGGEHQFVVVNDQDRFAAS
jgi:hypothetical protein